MSTLSISSYPPKLPALAPLLSSCLPFAIITRPSFPCITARPITVRWRSRLIISAQLCTEKGLIIDKSTLIVAEATSDEELWATATLRVRTFNEFRESVGIEDYKKYLAEREFEALKERVAGEGQGFKKVSCINASLPLSQMSNISDDICTKCKFSNGEEHRVVVGTLDLSQCLRLPEEITGTKPQGIGADFMRAYLSNVCVAKELHRNGVGYELISKSKFVAEKWGITDLYVHVVADNEPARKLYIKSGFTYESDEPASQARLRDRPRRILLWMGLPNHYNL